MSKKILDECLAIARKEMFKHPEKNCFMHWSFVIIKKKIIGWETNKQSCGRDIRMFGYNNPRRHKAHAELNVILKYIRKPYWDYYDIVNIRLNNIGAMRNSKPCVHCYNFIKKNHCRNIYFTTDLGFCKLL